MWVLYDDKLLTVDKATQISLNRVESKVKLGEETKKEKGTR